MTNCTGWASIHEEVKYLCKRCDYQINENGHFVEHKRVVHEGFKYPCRECDHQASSGGNLVQHKMAVHDRLKYPCGQCDYQASTKTCSTQKVNTLKNQTFKKEEDWCRL